MPAGCCLQTGNGIGPCLLEGHSVFPRGHEQQIDGRVVDDVERVGYIPQEFAYGGGYAPGSLSGSSSPYQEREYSHHAEQFVENVEPGPAAVPDVWNDQEYCKDGGAKQECIADGVRTEYPGEQQTGRKGEHHAQHSSRETVPCECPSQSQIAGTGNIAQCEGCKPRAGDHCEGHQFADGQVPEQKCIQDVADIFEEQGP